MFDVLCSEATLPKIETWLFNGGMNGLRSPPSASLTPPNLEWKATAGKKILFAFPNQQRRPWAPLVSR